MADTEVHSHGDDPWLARLVVSAMGAALLMGVAGYIGLAIVNREPPVGLSSLIGLLGGAMAHYLGTWVSTSDSRRLAARWVRTWQGQMNGNGHGNGGPKPPTVP